MTEKSHTKGVILDRLLIDFMVSSAPVLKPSFFQSLSLHSHLSLAQVHLLEFDHSGLGSHWLCHMVSASD